MRLEKEAARGHQPQTTHQFEAVVHAGFGGGEHFAWHSSRLKLPDPHFGYGGIAPPAQMHPSSLAQAV